MSGSANSWRLRPGSDAAIETLALRRLCAMNARSTGIHPRLGMPGLAPHGLAERPAGYFAVMSNMPLFLRTLFDEDLPEFETELRVRQIVDLARQTPFHAVANVGGS